METDRIWIRDWTDIGCIPNMFSLLSCLLTRLPDGLSASDRECIFITCCLLYKETKTNDVILRLLYRLFVLAQILFSCIPVDRVISCYLLFTVTLTIVKRFAPDPRAFIDFLMLECFHWIFHTFLVKPFRVALTRKCLSILGNSFYIFTFG